MPTLEYTLPGGQKLRQGRPFRIEGVASFPRNWLANATPEDLHRFEITVEEIPDPKPPAPTARDIDIEMIRRKEALFTMEQRERGYRLAIEAIAGGQALPDQVRAAWRQLEEIESAADAVRAMDPIPDDFRDDKYWRGSAR